MRVIIAGSRTITHEPSVWFAIRASEFDITEVVCGCANGVDMIGANWAIESQIPVKYFPPDWSAHGKAAGPIRNTEMAMYADALIAVWDGISKGTKGMIDLARKYHRKVYVYRVSQ